MICYKLYEAYKITFVTHLMLENKLIHNLQKLGLSKNDASVFINLLQAGQARVTDLSKKLNMHRQLVYNALDNLGKQQLVRIFQRQKVTYYQALDVTKLNDIFEQKFLLAKSISGELQHLQKQGAQEVIIYEGIEELKRLHLHVYEKAKKSSSMYILGSSSQWFETLGDEVIEKILTLQKKKNIVTYVISPEMESKENEFKIDLGKLLHYKTIPFISNKNTETAILEDRILIKLFIFPYTVIELVNKDVVAGYKEYFLSLWKQHDFLALRYITSEKS